MQPAETLSVSAQVAVAVAGFAGVVAAFGSEPIHDWSPVDRMRLRFLLRTFWPFNALLIAQVAASVVQFIRLTLNRGSRAA